MIPDESVDAAISALRGTVYKRDDVDMIWEHIALEVLEAAAPHMLAEAWDEGEEAGGLNHAAEEYPELAQINNPYRPTP